MDIKEIKDILDKYCPPHWFTGGSMKISVPDMRKIADAIKELGLNNFYYDTDIEFFSGGEIQVLSFYILYSRVLKLYADAMAPCPNLSYYKQDWAKKIKNLADTLNSARYVELFRHIGIEYTLTIHQIDRKTVEDTFNTMRQYVENHYLLKNCDKIIAESINAVKFFMLVCGVYKFYLLFAEKFEKKTIINTILNDKKYIPSLIFNLYKYYENNADIKFIFEREDIYGIESHFWNVGIHEYRRSNVFFDPHKYYLENCNNNHENSIDLIKKFWDANILNLFNNNLFRIKSVSNNMYWDIKNNSISDGTEMILWNIKSVNANNQKFRLCSSAQDRYACTIKPCHISDGKGDMKIVSLEKDKIIQSRKNTIENDVWYIYCLQKPNKCVFVYSRDKYKAITFHQEGNYKVAKLENFNPEDDKFSFCLEEERLEKPIPGKYYLKSYQGKYLSVQRNGTVQWNREAIGPWETVILETAGIGYAIKSCQGKYLSVQPDGTVQWNRDKIGLCETVILETAGPGYAIKSCHGKYLLVQPDGTVQWNREAIGQCETVILETARPGSDYAIKSCHGKYLSAQPDGKVQWNREAIGQWETVILETARPGSDYAIKSHHGKYLSAQPDGKVQWNRDKVGQWETVILETAGTGYAIKSHHGKYLSAQRDGTVQWNRDKVGQWETFNITKV